MTSIFWHFGELQLIELALILCTRVQDLVVTGLYSVAGFYYSSNLEDFCQENSFNFFWAHAVHEKQGANSRNHARLILSRTVSTLIKRESNCLCVRYGQCGTAADRRDGNHDDQTLATCLAVGTAGSSAPSPARLVSAPCGGGRRRELGMPVKAIRPSPGQPPPSWDSRRPLTRAGRTQNVPSRRRDRL